MNQITDAASFALLPGEAGFDLIEERLRAKLRATIEAVFDEELASFLGCLRYSRATAQRRAIAMGIWNNSSTGPSAPRQCRCLASGSRMKLAR